MHLACAASPESVCGSPPDPAPRLPSNPRIGGGCARDDLFRADVKAGLTDVIDGARRCRLTRLCACPLMVDPSRSEEFIAAACVPRDDHGSGTVEVADSIRRAHPRLATDDIYAAAVVGDHAEVERLLSEDAGCATTHGGPYGWDALTYLCFSRYLRLRPSAGFVHAARALLDAGADPNTGFFESAHQPEPVFESALYGAAGVAHHAELTQLLLARGADPKLGGEVAYHAPEGFEPEAMQAVVESGRLSDAGLTTMPHRKLDWTDLGGVRWLLEHGVDPNALSGWGDRALHHSLARDNALPLLEALLDFGADPTLRAPRHEDRTAVAVAERSGRARGSAP